MTVRVGDLAPDFTLKDQNNQELSLSSFRGEKSVLVVFYPLAFTGTCQGEMCEVRDDLGQFQNDTTQLVAISVDSPYAHKVWATDQGFDFPLLADFWPHGAVAQSYGVFNETAGIASRGTFLVDTDGIVRFAEMTGPGQARDQSGWRTALGELTTA